MEIGHAGKIQAFQVSGYSVHTTPGHQKLHDFS